MELQFVCVRVGVEARRWEARFSPHFFGLDGLRRVQGVVAAHVTSICMWVADDDVPLRVRQVLAVADQPFALTAALLAAPVPVLQHQGVVLTEERPESG